MKNDRRAKMEHIQITKPDDWHLHLRDNDMLKETVPATSRCFHRAIVMPNLVPPVTNLALADAYKSRILSEVPQGDNFAPLMTLYLTNDTTPEIIKEAKAGGIVASKLYPAGATTNSESGVSSLKSMYPVFQAMSDCGMLLLIHGEVTEKHVDIFDREKEFIHQHLQHIVNDFPNLKVVLEHITTSDSAEFVASCGDNVAATITPQHLLLNRNDLLVGGIKPHNYCLPVLKRNTHQIALREMVKSGNSKFFLGTDSAPHEKSAKESACGCAGCYSAWSAIELYAKIFEDLDALDKLEAFASFNGPDFYGLPRNTDKITLVKQEWQIPEFITLPNGNPIVPFYASQSIGWKLQAA